MNKQQLANKIWESANRMRSKIEANEYKDYILGFIFYKYLSDQEVRWLKEEDYTDDDIKELSEEDARQSFRIDPITGEKDSSTSEFTYIQKNVGYFIAYKDLFSTWLNMGNDFDVSNVTDALSAFGRNISPSHKKVFEGVFDTLQTGLSKLGDTSGARTKAISGLLQLIRDIPMDGKSDFDVLGFIYEYLIEKFAANAGKKAGEFYTPHEVSLLMSEIVANHLRNKTEIKIYDPTSGSGSLLINIGRSASKYIDARNIKYYAQELKENTYNLTRMNLVMRGIQPANIVTRCGDTLEDDWPFFEEDDPQGTYEPLYVDAVVSNPPYSQAWDPTNKESDPRYSRFGLAPKGKADYAFLLHDLYHIKPDGIMTIVLPHGVLFRGGEEGEIRKNLIENNHIDAIIGLPANIFFGTGIPTIIMVLKQKRENTDVLIIDASKGFMKEGKNNKLRACDIKKIADTVAARCEIDKFSKRASREEIRANEYNLNIPRYVDSSEAAESWDIYASMFGGIPKIELETLSEYWRAFPKLRADLFCDINAGYVKLAEHDIKTAVSTHSDVNAFVQGFDGAFADFDAYLRTELIDNMMNIIVSQEEDKISNNIFARMQNIPLLDKYEAYQLLDDEWNKIAVDLEIIQTEGFEATKKVDPNMVLKKKNGRDEEVQEGYVGHVIPFELVQTTKLKSEYDALKSKESRLCEIPSEYEEILDTLSDEEKSEDYVTEDGSAFVAKEVTKKVKELKKDGDAELLEKLLKVTALFDEEKALKAKIKEETSRLEALSKTTIENLTDAEVLELLEMKWIASVTANLKKLPGNLIDGLINKITAFDTKYENTYFEVENSIKDTENSLCSMIDELCGSEFDMLGLEEFKKMLGGCEK